MISRETVSRFYKSQERLQKNKEVHAHQNCSHFTEKSDSIESLNRHAGLGHLFLSVRLTMSSTRSLSSAVSLRNQRIWQQILLQNRGSCDFPVAL